MIFYSSNGVNMANVNVQKLPMRTFKITVIFWKYLQLSSYVPKLPPPT